jgi:hypothetical protein
VTTHLYRCSPFVHVLASLLPRNYLLAPSINRPVVRRRLRRPCSFLLAGDGDQGHVLPAANDAVCTQPVTLTDAVQPGKCCCYVLPEHAVVGILREK